MGTRFTLKHLLRYGAYLWVVLILGSLYLLYLREPPFSPDSWSYYELSKHIFDDFYRINTWRQFQIDTPYGISFPPLWPTILAVFNAVLQLDIYTGYLVNFMVSFLTFVFLIQLSKTLFGESAPGLVLYLSLLLNYAYLGEVVAARSIPLSVLLLVVMIWQLMREEKLSGRTLIVLGLLAGLSTLNRFDFLLSGTTLGLVAVYHARERWVQAGLKYYAAFATSLLPWIVYSLSHFGRLFISDNFRTVLAAHKVFVDNYYAEPPPTLFDEPLAWLVKTKANSGGVLRSALEHLSSDVLILLALAALVGILWRGIHKGTFHALHERVEQLGMGQRILHLKILHLSALFVVIIGTVALTGYPSQRYFITSRFYLLLLFLSILWPLVGFERFLDRSLRLKHGIVVAVVFVLLGGVVIGVPLQWEIEKGRFSQQGALQGFPPLLDAREYDPWLACLGEERERARLLILDEDLIHSYRFGALTSVTTFISPRNVSVDNLALFLRDYPITHVVVTDADFIRILGQETGYTRTCDLPLYRLGAQ